MNVPADQTASESPQLRVRGLHTWFTLRQWGFFKAGDVRALDGISFDVQAGEAVAFVGESGCGKSTLARTLIGLTRPTSGEITFEGTAVSSLSGAELKRYRARVGYIQQDPYGALPPFMDIQRILAEPLKIHGYPRDAREQRIRNALEEVRLTPVEEYLAKFPHMLSGGQQQRIVIARALVLEPAMLVADEPVSMLDASVRVEILELLSRIQRERELTLAYITHDLSTVRHYTNRAFVMYAGRIVEQAGVNALIDAPQHPYTQALLAALADPDPGNAHRDREVPEGEPPSLVHPPAGCRFHPRCPQVMTGKCDVDDPPDFEPDERHYSACWLHQS
jgi:peptide/nickel transport system ATP-binding protein